MKIVHVQPINCYVVETDEPFTRYTRYGPKVWYVSTGILEEPVYEPEEIEKLFRKFNQERGL